MLNVITGVMCGIHAQHLPCVCNNRFQQGHQIPLNASGPVPTDMHTHTHTYSTHTHTIHTRSVLLSFSTPSLFYNPLHTCTCRYFCALYVAQLWLLYLSVIHILFHLVHAIAGYSTCNSCLGVCALPRQV